MSLGKTELNEMGCSTPNCTHDHSTLFLIPGCHRGAAVDVKYVKATGVLTVQCHKCKRLVVELKVAD